MSTKAKKNSQKPGETANAEKLTAAVSAPKKPVARDSIGNRIGTQAACINAALTKEPQPLEGIASACKLGNQRVRSHMASLVKRGIAVQSKDGFALQ